MSGVLTIALTGGIGSGKSTVAKLFAKRGAPVIDADIIARELVQADSPLLKKIVHEFGPKILTEQQELDREELGNIVFNSPERKKHLESLMHPAIYAEINRRISTLNFPYCLVVIPLLIETGATAQFDRVLLVDVPEALQMSRTSNRDRKSMQLVKKIMNTQASREQRLVFADDVIENDTTIDELDSLVTTLHDKFIALSGKKTTV